MAGCLRGNVLFALPSFGAVWAVDVYTYFMSRFRLANPCGSTQVPELAMRHIPVPFLRINYPCSYDVQVTFPLSQSAARG